MTTSTVDSRIARIAARQAGRFSRAQALAVGVTDSSAFRRLRAGRWERVHPGVYTLGGTPPTWIGDVWAAVLAAGPLATVTHETAIRLHGSQHVAPLPVTLTIPHGGHARIADAVVHQIDDLRPGDVASVEGLPVSRVPRAVVELAAVVGPRRLGRVLDDLVFDRRTTYAQVAAALAQVARPGKPGVAALASALDERSGSAVPADSELERTLYAALVGRGLPAPRCQAPLPGRGAVEGLVDAAYPDCRLILEADGRRWHTRVAALRRDHERDAEAARAGWQTLRFVHEQIEGHPDEVADVVADVRAVRLSAPRAALVATAARAHGGPGAASAVVPRQ
jgi:very-short-patch-repair endonuclease